MYEENRRFSWTGLFIKIIIVIIFILFTVWLLNLSTKSATRGLSNSLDVLTDNIFSENIDRMKEVGKSYFTTERLPKKVGEIKTLTLAKMYDENLILEIKDKNGNACSAKNSYVSIEKMDTEYQMKVYLECGEESSFVKVIMGCYNYCSTDICEKKENAELEGIEYQYSKATGGAWGPYGSWSEWSKTSVSKTNERDIETKVVKENYTYDKTVTESKYTGNATCPTAPSGYTLQSNSNGLCTYTKVITTTADPNKCASSYNGYSLVSQNGLTCNYSKGTSTTVSANNCASTYNGYSLVSQNGLICNYSKETSTTVNANACAKTYNGYTLVSQNGLTCNYSKTSTETIPATPHTTGGETTKNCYKVVVGTKTVMSCNKTCKQVIQNVYETRCDTKTTPVKTTYSCPSSAYTLSGAYCYRSVPKSTTTNAGCPSGSVQSGNGCVKKGNATTTTNAGCPSGSVQSGNGCVKSSTTSTTTSATCPSGYTGRNGICAKDTTSKIVKDTVCSTDENMRDGKCYKNVSTTQTITDTKNVTYYRYRLRSYTGGTTDYKWSTSNNDKSLIDTGYKLTGKTRNIGGK